MDLSHPGPGVSSSCTGSTEFSSPLPAPFALEGREVHGSRAFSVKHTLHKHTVMVDWGFYGKHTEDAFIFAFPGEHLERSEFPCRVYSFRLVHQKGWTFTAHTIGLCSKTLVKWTSLARAFAPSLDCCLRGCCCFGSDVYMAEMTVGGLVSLVPCPDCLPLTGLDLIFKTPTIILLINFFSLLPSQLQVLLLS